MPASNLSARYITGRSTEDLQMKILAYQTRFARHVKIITIYQEKDGKVTAWFYDDASALLEEKLNGRTK